MRTFCWTFGIFIWFSLWIFYRSQDLEAFNARHKVKKPVFDPVWPSSVAEDFEALRYGKDAVGLAQMTTQRREAAGGMRPSYLTDVFAMLDDFRINNINKVRNAE